MKKTVLYIIDSLEVIGGAELMLLAPLPEIHNSYKIIVVTLYPACGIDRNFFPGDKQYCLNMRSRKDVFKAARELKRIIRDNKVDLVHSFLYWSIVVARLACGKHTSHIFSLSTMMKDHIYTHKWYSRYTQLIDIITYKSNQVVIAPTREVLMDFKKSVGIKGKSRVLHNFVLDEFFDNQAEYNYTPTNLKLVAVGNLKEVKNYQVLIDAFKLLDQLPVKLDIYGEGALRNSLQEQITENKLPITLKGSCNKIYESLRYYDAFVMSSFVEGFGISVAEAMSVGLPVLLSDIKVLREVSQNNALFFDPHSPQSFAKAINSILSGQQNLNSFSEKGKNIARENYKKEKYIGGLLSLYEQTAGNN